MALTVKQLIEKLEKVENKDKDVYFETPDTFLSVDRVFNDEDDDIIVSNDVESEHCYCSQCEQAVTEL